MKAITLRNLPDTLSRLIRRKAATEGISLNRAVIKVLEERFGSGQGLPESRHHELDALSGSWSDAEAQAFDRTLAAQRVIDPELWK
jgi:plasmid stability protein